jgi:CDP-glucose 4,6-dehydratase
MHVLVTGHTGFKGAWLVSLLNQLGHSVSGLALDPIPGSLFDCGGFDSRVRQDFRGDIRSVAVVQETLREAQPDIVVHLAAQSLVLESYVRPRETYEVNVFGTLNVLETIKANDCVSSAVIVTTDKVYANTGKLTGYVETDPLGGADPYSSSKAMADLLTSGWAQSFDVCPLGIARAGNVIGGGDVSAHRLMPDLMRDFTRGTPAAIRNPKAVRPWQHVLDCLNGYLLLIDFLEMNRSSGAWNFGPEPTSFTTVAELADTARDTYMRLGESHATWNAITVKQEHEAALLTLDSTKARGELGWRDHLTFEQAVEWTVEWAVRVNAGESAARVTDTQVQRFLELRG